MTHIKTQTNKHTKKGYERPSSKLQSQCTDEKNLKVVASPYCLRNTYLQLA